MYCEIGLWEGASLLYCEIWIGFGFGCGCSSWGRRVFDRMKCRNVYAWTAMVNGYVQNGASDEALILFRKMQVEDGIQPNRVSLVSVLPACVIHAVLMGGKQIHGFAIRKEMNHDKFLTKGFDPYPCMRFLSLV
ncbi:hypothetical protein M0R45_003346 [Rubus argutus]|uniref:Pentatricopeptide repeat-containing protein n=1 Tax=Rubus argutus TaxID=59490 RepID=A0AAW1YH60_RUBAR